MGATRPASGHFSTASSHENNAMFKHKIKARRQD